VTATAAPANTGSASIGQLAVVSPTINPDHTATIDFTGAASYAWELRDRTSNALIASGTGSYNAGAPIALNGFELKLDGAPRAGDSFSVTRTLFPGQNNGNALAFVGLRDYAFVGREPLSGGGLGQGLTIGDAYASAMAQVGVAVQGATTAADISGSVARQAEASRTAFSGVNLDEEAARLLQQQQGYQAAARVLQVAQSIFDTLLESARA
jgi:flagellar hook-associated protein 1 FlgK